MKSRFRFGAWFVHPSTNSIDNGDERRQMEPRTMDVLLALCMAKGDIVSADELLAQCWGSTLYGDSPVHKNIAQLRRILGDNATSPVYIETIRKRGYRALAPLEFDVRDSAARKNWRTGSPFRGLLAFDESHADVFFGRDESIRQLCDAVQAQVNSGFALMLVLGPSGSGKTSLIQAGLLPALSRERAGAETRLLASTTFDLIDQGEQTLFTALAGTLLDLQWEDRWAFPGENAVSLGTRLEQGCASVIAELAAALAERKPPGTRFGIFIDRFEALFNVTRISEPQRRAFLHTLEQLARSSVAVLVLACRNDFYPSLARYALLTEGKRHGGHFDLGPPGVSDFAEIIRKPAAAARLTFGVDPVSLARLDDVLCKCAADSPDALPLLQYCLQELYRMRMPDGELSFDAFHQLGDLEGAIGLRAEQVVLAMSEAQQAFLPHIMSLVSVLSIDEENVSSQRAPWSALRGEAARQAMDALVESRLFVSDLVGGVPVFGIAHDAILRRWPRMTDWITAHRGALRARGRLAQQAGRWRDEGGPVDFLLPQGKPLDEAKELRQAGVLSLTELESEFIRSSERRARQRDRVRVLALALIVVLALLASILGLSALAAKRTAELRRGEAESLMDYMLGDFADKLRPLGRLEFLESVSLKALHYLSGSQGDDLSPNALTLRARALQVIGEVSRSRGDSKHAIDALQQANAILMRQHRMAPQDTQVLKNLGANAYWVGQMHKDQNNWQAAEDAWREYQKFADLLHRLEPENVEWWVEQSYAHNNLGALAQTRGMPQQAVPQFLQSIALKRRALEHAPNSHSVAAELADSYSWLASAKESLGELDEAQQLYAHEMQLALGLRERFPGESMWIYRLVRALQHRAMLGVARGMDAEALRDYDEAKQLFTQIVGQDRNNRAWQGELTNLEQERLRVLARGMPAEKALPRLTAVHAQLQAMLALDPKNASWARREALARARMGGALRATGRVQAAQKEIGKAGAALQQLYARNPSSLSGRLALIETLLLQATLQHEQKDFISLMMTCKQAYGMIKEEGASTMNHQILDPWVRVNACLQNDEAVQLAASRLKQIGYREQSYVHFISTR